MTEIEAIEELKNSIISYEVQNPSNITCDLTTEVLDMAIQALEKQMPKKPDCIEDKMWCCPVCDNHLLHKWIKYPTKLMPKAEGLPHCMSCGQAIDWSEEE